MSYVIMNSLTFSRIHWTRNQPIPRPLPTQ